MNNELPIPSLSPAFFFQISCDIVRSEGKDIQRNKFKLPHHSWLLDEEEFSDVYMSWNEGGISFAFEIHKPFDEARYPQFEEGDSVEIFLDTRNMKEATYAHRFCHHFLVLPAEVQGVRALELTRLRADDKRPLCDPDEIGVITEFSKKKYSMKIAFPASCLYGFDPAISQHVGCTYRINRAGGGAQHLAVSSRDCAIAQYPALWASMKLAE